MDKYNQIRSTIFVDQCQIRMHLVSVPTPEHNQPHSNSCSGRNRDHDKLDMRYPTMHMIVLTSSDSINMANITCLNLWNQRKSMKNVFIVCPSFKTTHSKSRARALNELTRYWNIPYISFDADSETSRCDLFNFAVKYYWFCNVVQ